jgi:hypothetical protein
MQEDPLQDLKEGIFIFLNKGKTCRLLPVGEEDYLSNYAEAAKAQEKEEELEILETEMKLDAAAQAAGNQSGVMS